MLAASALSVGAQNSKNDPGFARVGRNPNQPIDSAYTAKIKEYTTEPFFLSPLVDYMPASKTVPTPMATLGDIAGARNKLPYTKEVHDYMRLLEKSTKRVKVYSIGTSEEGREMIAVAVASEALMAKMESNKAQLAKLADPRTINMNDKLADDIAATAAPVYYVTGTIHSTETGAPTALMELAYRLAVDESPYVKNIRDHVITLITPVVETDGRDRMVDVFNYKLKRPNEPGPSLLYWGKYVAHDNNRDAMGMTLKLTQNVLNTYVGHKAQVLHDLHESGSFLYDNTIGDGPYNAWLDPLLTNEWQMIGWNNVQEMTRLGMPGVFAHGTFDTWSPGYLMFIAATHNGVSRLYETFGNSGSAETLERTLSAGETARNWYRQNPPITGRFKWSLRNNNNYEITGLLVSLSYTANTRVQLLRNFYEKSKRSIQKAKTEGPAAYVLPANDPRLGTQADLLKVLQLQAVEISRATSEFTVTMPRRAAAGAAAGAGGRGGRGGGAGEAPAASAAPQTETRSFPAGSYIIRMDQPYSRIADALLDYQYWAPNEPQRNPYDDTGWTFPEAFGVQAVRVTDTTVLKVPMTQVTGTILGPNGVTGTGSVFAINHNADNALMTLRYALKDADMQAAEEPFDAAGQKFNRGSFIIRGVSQDALDKTTKELGLKAYALGAAPTVKTHPLRAARIAIVHGWSSTQTEGWWRIGFDMHKIPYSYISYQDLTKDTNINSKYDVLVFTPGGGAPLSIIQGMPMWRNAVPWKKSAETPNIGDYAQTDDIRPGLGWEGLQNVQAFVSRGGVLIGAENTAEFAIQFGISNGVSSGGPSNRAVVGSLLRTKLTEEVSPITYGIIDNLAVYSSDGMTLSVNNQRGGRVGGGGGGAPAGGGGGGRGGGGARATGRGTADDPDVVQGMRPMIATNLDSAPPAPRPVSAWQVAVPTVDQLRNPLNIIPPDQRPRVPLRFADQGQLLVSGLLDGGADIAQRPVVVDSPLDKGHVVLFANNPVYRGTTIGSYFLVFNTILNWDNLNAGKVLPVR
ncbi:MAG: M14 family zinc carboxypeptidase [Gemmatimonas sp.]